MEKKVYIALYLLLTVSTALSFLYGARAYFRKHVPLFHQLVVCALGCMMLGRIYELTLLLTQGNLPEDFHLGCFGALGGFAFLFSASYGQMDGLVDGKEKGLRKYRIIALAAPVCLMLPVLLLAVYGCLRVWTVLLMAMVAAASYYHFKHLIIPDVDFGIIRSIRGYNLSALLLEILCVLQIMGQCLATDILWAVFTVLMSAAYMILIPAVRKGSKKWTA